jgi:hypothetical protein
MSVKLEAGQWYRTRGGEIVYCVGIKPVQTATQTVYDAVVVCREGYSYDYISDGLFINGESDDKDLIEHLPDCTGFDWEPPKPVVVPEGWRLLDEGETILDTDKWWEGRYWDDMTGSSTIGKPLDFRIHTPVARKIEPPQPKYRPFKDGAEFKPFRDKWVKYKQSDVGKTMLCVSFSNEGVTACVSFMPYKTAFDSLVFEDGSPFGVTDGV